MNKNNETIDWNALIAEYKSNQNFISMIDFCNHHHVSIDDMKYHYHKQKSDHTKKVLHWCINGFELYTKTVTDKSKYQWPNDENEAMLITKKQLSWLLDGLSIHQSKAFHEMKQRIF